MTYAGWHIDLLSFEGKEDKKAQLTFTPGLTLIFGASNTGKSLAVKAFDFMLGSSQELPNITERRPYNRLFMAMTLANGRQIRLERGLAGGSFRLTEADREASTLTARHDADSANNLSNFLLREMGSSGKKIAVDAAGTHSNLSFRDIARVVLTDEISIQSETSPIESGDRGAGPRERSVLKYLLTGDDDSAVVPLVKPKDFRTGRTAQAKMLQDMIDQIGAELAAKYPDQESLEKKCEDVDAEMESIEGEMADVRSSVRSLLDDKRRLTSEIASIERRTVDISLSLDSFEQLQEVYDSDIARLESIEEAGFLLSLDGQKPCPVCGAPPESQAHTHGLTEIETMRVAAEVEIQKITRQREELVKTVSDTEGEALRLVDVIKTLRASLIDVETKLEKATPDFDAHRRELAEVLTRRDRIRHGLDLLERRNDLSKQKTKIDATKPPKREDTIQSGLSSQTAKEFADVVADVLLEWGFPGQKKVFFDPGTYDLVIDGKERRHNGKGVRAITHAAFKVALLLYCRDRKLPHPGFLVLDTPLLTYRDPFKKPGDKLMPDEEELRNTDLKERFFEHLGHIGADAQFMIFENVDPPPKIYDYALVETFTNDPSNGRQGLL
jgi:predicted  nucleic acid-binding Zn-ribbon protein